MDSIRVIKNHIENIRIQTFEQGFYSFQALNENIFDNKNILDNIRFRFYQTKSQNKVEISKKGNLKAEEIFAVLGIYKFFLSSNGKKHLNPVELLARLGIQVFNPEEEELKGNIYDFSQVAGYEEVKKEIQDSIILPIQRPEAFDEVSKLTRKFPTRNRPRAILFEGDPGVGKTTMARIVAFQCKIPLIYVPIESIMSKYYGESSQNLAYVFDAAALFPSSLIFLDEIDSLAGNREDGMFEATRNLLSVLLRKLDGFEGKPKTMTLGATNRKQDLDKALLSRFDKSIYFPLPNPNERKEILKNYAIQLE
ncbi:MAG: ATP-binding protein, partial [Leptospiraceae bacterium]|nr:ATP-binding protein [Leptospiraceae bacterium]